MVDVKPLHLKVIRHGESEGNFAQKRDELGDPVPLNTLIAHRHETNYRLTDLGRWQLEQTGIWIREQGYHFDVHLCSDTVRGRESAGCLNLPDATWTPLSMLRERDVREYQALTHAQQQLLIQKLSGGLLNSPYYYHPFGEAPADLIDQRVSPMIQKVSNKDFKSVLWVCHGDYMRALQSRIWHFTKDEFAIMYLSERREAMVLNGAVHEYSRVDPSNSTNILPDFGWFKSYCPSCPNHPSNTDWVPITRVTFSNAALLTSVEPFEQLVNNPIPKSKTDLLAEYD